MPFWQVKGAMQACKAFACHPLEEHWWGYTRSLWVVTVRGTAALPSPLTPSAPQIPSAPSATQAPRPSSRAAVPGPACHLAAARRHHLSRAAVRPVLSSRVLARWGAEIHSRGKRHGLWGFHTHTIPRSLSTRQRWARGSCSFCP